MQFVYIYKSFGQIHWNGIRYHNLYHRKNNLQIENGEEKNNNKIIFSERKKYEKAYR